MKSLGVFLLSTERGGDDATAYSRMLAPDLGEDPATGSASGPLGAFLGRYDAVPREKAGEILSRQGVHMGRPSRVYVSMRLEGDAIREVRVGGASALVGEGEVLLPAS